MSIINTRTKFMPMRYESSAPKWDGNPYSLQRFFKDVKTLGERWCDVSHDAPLIKATLDYVEKNEDYDLWLINTVDCWNDWTGFKDKIMSLYPEAQPQNRYTVESLQRLVNNAGRDCSSFPHIADYYRKFNLISNSIKQYGTLDMTDSQLAALFLEGLRLSDSIKVEFYRAVESQECNIDDYTSIFRMIVSLFRTGYFTQGNVDR